MHIVFWIASTALAALSLLPLSRHEAWWVRSLDFPRLQLFALTLVVLLAVLLWLDLRDVSTALLVTLNAGCLVYHGWWIAPYTPLFPAEVDPAPPDGGPCLRILVANVLASNRQADALLALVDEHRPDVLVTLESNAWWQGKLDTLEAVYPHAIKCPRENLYGMHVYSRLPIEDAHISYLVQDDVPSMHALLRLSDGQRVRMHFLHPAPPSPTQNDESSERDAELVIVGRRVADNRAPTIVTGDLNDVAWSRTTRLFRKISGLLDPRVGRGMFNTFHAGHWYLRWPLDHLFHSGHFKLRSLRRLPSIGSDHFPLLTELVLCGDGRSSEDGLQADATDRRRARDKIDDEGVDAGDVPRPASG
jgi:endonuclease/exonuclease/phosphatase (EEP) superfamily protein YafD